MKSTHSLQGIIQCLHGFWSSQGCTIWNPHGEKVGAGTMNPATFLRVLGPEPWHVGYVEPSFRADDGRYAENPNRMQMHTQYQVILKPEPGHPQELYLASLSALGLDRCEHDIRFVEDNWESPALGAWGLGWEVWLDGQEITQFTYFQQAGGQVLDPVSVEITYGLERIAMFLQNRSEVWSIDVDGKHTYADLYKTHEVEHSRYNFDTASIERLQALHALYQAEADACLEQGLAYLAYDYLLRQSHNFNLLDARGAIGVTERAQFFGDMRRQAREVSTLYLAERLREEYPFLSSSKENIPKLQKAKGTSARPKPETTETRTLLVEVGMEELPAHEVAHGLQQLQVLVPQYLKSHRLKHGPITMSGTVRRLVIRVEDLVAHQADEETERRGPSLRVAFDRDGTPTKAAAGFARSCGQPVGRLIRKDGYLFAQILSKGQSAATVLPEVLTNTLDSLRWSKSMRWNASGVSFPRPVRWLMAFLGSTTISWTWGGITAGPTTRGPRYMEARQQAADLLHTYQRVSGPAEYLAWLEAQGIVLDRPERKAEVLKQVSAAAAALGGIVQADEDLLEEVTDLIEAPRVLSGTFPSEYLDLPVAVLITVMRKHQRYFPVYKADHPDQLLPHFITVVNGLESQNPEAIRTGNESVVNARFADAAFFVKRDLATSLDEMRERLQTLTFHMQLGTMWDKVQRLVALAPVVCQLAGLNAAEQTACERAAALCKCDLVMQMVVEMTSLQGTMMEFYARTKGEQEMVCRAISEHYQPRSAEGPVPGSRAGLVLSIVDRLDSLLGLMAVGVRASGNSDPFGLRRLGLGLVKGLIQKDMDFDLEAGIAAAARIHDIDVPPETEKEALAFLDRRLQILMREQGLPLDVIEAVTSRPVRNPLRTVRVAEELAIAADQPEWHEQLMAYIRCVRILPKDYTKENGSDPMLETQAEKALYSKIQEVGQLWVEQPTDVATFRAAMSMLYPLINSFFETVMVLAEDPVLRHSRLGLMADIRSLGQHLGDLTQLHSEPRSGRVEC